MLGWVFTQHCLILDSVPEKRLLGAVEVGCGEVGGRSRVRLKIWLYVRRLDLLGVTTAVTVTHTVPGKERSIVDSTD